MVTAWLHVDFRHMATCKEGGLGKGLTTVSMQSKHKLRLNEKGVICETCECTKRWREVPYLCWGPAATALERPTGRRGLCHCSFSFALL